MKIKQNVFSSYGFSLIYKKNHVVLRETVMFCNMVATVLYNLAAGMNARHYVSLRSTF